MLAPSSDVEGASSVALPTTSNDSLATGVAWIGASRVWHPPPRDDKPPEFAMALVEDTVLQVGARRDGTRHLSLAAAINCSSRLALRVALATTGLNPDWWPYRFGGSRKRRVVKAPASALGSGVREFGHPIEEVQELELYAPELAQFGVVEEYADGEQYELDGFVLGGRPTFFHPLRECWVAGRIASYRRADPPSGLREAVATAVRAIGLDDSPFCAELRHSAGRWVLIEVHARLGEDEGLVEQMWDSCPLRAIEAAAAAAAGQNSTTALPGSKRTLRTS
jgi:hypothetical protein